jgi:hypothetical protein
MERRQDGRVAERQLFIVTGSGMQLAMSIARV